MPEPEQTRKPILECKLKYLLRPGAEQTPLEAQAVLTAEDFTLMPNLGTPLLYSLREINSIKAEDHRLQLTISGGEELELLHLGYTFDDFVRVFSRACNELKIQDMLMQESLRTQGVSATFLLDTDGSQPLEGKCEPRLYETALVVLQEFGAPIRIPYSNISALEATDYVLSLKTDLGQRLMLSHMGGKFDYFTAQLSTLMNELSLKAQLFLKDLLPQAQPIQIREAAQLMREGKAARRGDLDAICPRLWNSLEQRLEVMGLKHEYDFLRSRALPEKISIGFKRGLMGDLTGEYIWFLIPIWESANVMAMEAASGTGGGRATYFFRLASRAVFSRPQTETEINTIVDTMIGRINQGMLAINFRREPIYLPEQRLTDPRYDKYRHAIALLPALQELRELFIGRVFHHSEEQWEQDVRDLLAFNISSEDDSQKWSKAGESLELSEDEDTE